MPDGDRLSRVTSIERRVAAPVAGGLTNGQIADRLGCSPHTISRHVSNILMKLDMSTRVQIAVLAEKAGWTSEHGREN